MKIGYARVSRDDQELGRQITALKAAGCEVIFQEKMSGKNTARPELELMIKSLQAGDTIIVQKIDRLGRSLWDLLGLIRKFQSLSVTFQSLDDQFDTGNAVGRLCFHLMLVIAEFERDLIRERTQDGIAQTRRKGTKLGRPKVSNETIERVKAMKGLGITHIAKETKLSRPTIYKILELCE